MAYLENSSNLTLTSYDEDSFVNTANADSANYSLRYPSVKGDPVGILVASGSLTPLQATGTGIDIATNQTLYSAYIAPKNIATAFIISSASPYDWDSVENDNLWGNTTNTSIARQ